MDAKPSKTRKPLVEVWKAYPLWLRLLIIFAASALTVVAGCLSGKAGDCGPHDVDGQCGLSTFAGLLTGLAGGAVVLLVGSVWTVVQWHRSRKSGK
jgi:hypothetical protein